MLAEVARTHVCISSSACFAKRSATHRKMHESLRAVSWVSSVGRAGAEQAGQGWVAFARRACEGVRARMRGERVCACARAERACDRQAARDAALKRMGWLKSPQGNWRGGYLTNRVTRPKIGPMALGCARPRRDSTV